MKKTISIVGGGACALMLGCELDTEKFDVCIYDKNTALGRKFLVAGEGGLNLTHSENQIDFLNRYTPSNFMEKAFLHFSNNDFIKWINAMGIETFVGSSGRVFPKKGTKPIAVLNTLLDKIKTNKVVIKSKHEWKGFTNDNQLIFENHQKTFSVKSDYVIFCLGGASWSVTGSMGNWVNYFSKKEIDIVPFQASNCAFKINWKKEILSQIEGKALKNAAFMVGNKTHLGEVVFTNAGVEGSGIYPLSPQIRAQLNEKDYAELIIDLKPNLTQQQLLQKLDKFDDRKSYTQNISSNLHLNALQISLLKSLVSKEAFMNKEKLTEHIKGLKLRIIGCGEIENAISTVGGISLQEVDCDFELQKLPKHFVIGEMLDFDAPTGGYLLQACFSMGNVVAQNFNKNY